MIDGLDYLYNKENFVRDICTRARKKGLIVNDDYFFRDALNLMYDKKGIGLRDVKIIFHLIVFLNKNGDIK